MLPFAGSQASAVHDWWSSTSTGVWTQPLCVSQESTVQALPSSQLRGEPGRQAPVPLQTSPPVQALPSSQAAPAGSGEWVHSPPAPQTSFEQSLSSSQSPSVTHGGMTV